MDIEEHLNEVKRMSVILGKAQCLSSVGDHFETMLENGVETIPVSQVLEFVRKSKLSLANQST